MTHTRKPDVLPVKGASIAEALKACPFCGEDAELEYGEGESPDVYAQCTGCQAQGPATRYGCRDEDDAIDLEAEAAELWNKRPAEEMADLCAEAMGSQLLDVQQDAIAKGKELRSALERAAAEEEAHRWIPVSERMPAEGAPVWAFDEGEVCPAYWSGQFWWVAGDGPTLDCVTEWMPRYVPRAPAPPKGST